MWEVINVVVLCGRLLLWCCAGGYCCGVVREVINVVVLSGRLLFIFAFFGHADNSWGANERVAHQIKKKLQIEGQPKRPVPSSTNNVSWQSCSPGKMYPLMRHCCTT